LKRRIVFLQGKKQRTVFLKAHGGGTTSASRGTWTRPVKKAHYIQNGLGMVPMSRATWQTVEAKQRFSELVEAAGSGGPQVVMRHKEPVAVVLSPDDYRRLVRQADANFARLLARSPFGPEDVEPIGMSLA
jgi:prevent-host-death family protein